MDITKGSKMSSCPLSKTPSLLAKRSSPSYVHSPLSTSLTLHILDMPV